MAMPLILGLVGCDAKDNSDNKTSNANPTSTSNSNSNIESNVNEDSNVLSNSNVTSNSNPTSNSNEVKPASNTNTQSNSNKETPVSTTKTNVVGKTTKGYDIEKIDGIYYVKGILIANKSYALPSTYAPGGLKSEFTIAYNEMKNAAKKDGVTLSVVSGYRSYKTQTTLYNNYVKRDGKAAADTYSARAGHSEHQTGLAADLNKISDSFGETKAGKWLANNCYKYGFILRYPKGKQSITGYVYEPWHFRYIGDEAVNLYNNGNWITLEEYLGIDSKY